MSKARINALVMQSGGCTHVLNRSLYGIASEWDETGPGTVYGAPHGFEGVLLKKHVDLSKVTAEQWRSIMGAPGAAIGSTRRELREADVASIFEYLDRLDIGFWFIIGGNDSAGTGHALQTAARTLGYDLSVVNVPKTIDNDLVLTDHCPGYGSAARFVAMATMGSGRDAEALQGASPISIIEVMGRDAGWLAAGAALARRDEGDAPHLICVPEVPLDEHTFIARIEEAYSSNGFAVAVVSENARGPNGVIGGQTDPWFVDDFGHEYYDGPARYLAGLVSQALGVRARYEKPGTIQRSFVASVSVSDADEAELAGRAAVTAAREGLRDVIVTLVRRDGPEYACTTGLAALDQVGGVVRKMPPEFLAPDEYFVTSNFMNYLSPLVGSLPRFGRLT